MLPLNLFGKSLSPPFIILPEDNNSAVFTSGALTPQKRTTTEPHVSVPLAKKLQLSSESDTSDLFPEDIENSSNMNAVFENPIAPLKFTTPDTLDSSDVVGTPAFITTLMMKFIKFSDEQRQADEKHSMNWQSDLPNNADIKSFSTNNDNNLIPPTSLFEDLTRAVGYHASGFPSTNSRADIADSDDEDLEMKDDDELLLNNLPTSVDDLQDMEQQIKLERQMNSPLISHRQSPADAGRLSVLSGDSYAMDGMHSSASIHPEEELDEDDMEVAMINESFEEQQRQYKLYCGDELKSVFYSAPVENSLSSNDTSYLPSYQMPVSVPDSPFNDQIYGWGEELSQVQPIDLSLSVTGGYDSTEGQSKLLPSLSSTKGSMESFKFYENNSKLSHESSSNMIEDGDDDAIATVLSSANFVLENIESPHKTPADLEDEDQPIMMIAKQKSKDNYESEDEELVRAWKHFENPKASNDNISQYDPWSNNTPSIVDHVVVPTKNIKSLNHVVEIYETCGELDSEPMLQYFQSIGMKNFYQCDVDIQRAFLVFSTASDANYAVNHNNTKLKIRLLEESPQFIKMKALEMFMELQPCKFKEEEKPSTRESYESLNHSKPIVGV